jgi:hypothetical protein
MVFVWDKGFLTVSGHGPVLLFILAFAPHCRIENRVFP